MSDSINIDGGDGTTWRKWAGNLSSLPEEILKPVSLKEVQELVRNRNCTKASQTLLYPAYSANPEDRVCWIEILRAYPKDEPDPGKRSHAMKAHMAMIKEVVPKWIKDGKGRPHWAKNWQYVQPTIMMHDLYPAENLRALNTLRQKLDPEGAFIKAFFEHQNLFSR